MRVLTLVAVTGIIATFLVVSSQSESPHVPLHPVCGHILCDGLPAPTASLVFHPLNATDKYPCPVGLSGPDGAFVLATRGVDGAPEGEYIVTVEWRMRSSADFETASPPLDLTHPCYRRPQSSPLRVRIGPHANTIDLRMSRTPPSPDRPNLTKSTPPRVFPVQSD